MGESIVVHINAPWLGDISAIGKAVEAAHVESIAWDVYRSRQQHIAELKARAAVNAMLEAGLAVAQMMRGPGPKWHAKARKRIAGSRAWWPRELRMLPAFERAALHLAAAAAYAEASK